MITINGIVKRSGVTIAVAAIVDSKSGINSVSPDLLQDGIHALMRGTSPNDFPEAIIICDNLAVGMSIKLPGIRTIAIAAQSEMDFPGMDPEVPCIIGLPDIMHSVNQGDIIIVDGNEGAVYIDPDPQTLIRHQQAEDQHSSRSRFFIGTQHLPAKTQDGETVYSYACVNNLEEIMRAIDAGADGLLVDLRDAEVSLDSFYRDVLFTAAGKPVAFATSKPPVEIIESAKKFSSPGQVRILFPSSDYGELINIIEPILEEMMIEAQENPDAPAVGIGTFTDNTELKDDYGYYEAIDMRESDLQNDKIAGIGKYMAHWTKEKDAPDAIIVIGNRIDAIKSIILAGARSIAVSPDLIADAKYIIREIGLENFAE